MSSVDNNLCIENKSIFKFNSSEFFSIQTNANIMANITPNIGINFEAEFVFVEQ